MLPLMKVVETQMLSEATKEHKLVIFICIFNVSDSKFFSFLFFFLWGVFILVCKGHFDLHTINFIATLRYK